MHVAMTSETRPAVEIRRRIHTLLQRIHIEIQESWSLAGPFYVDVKTLQASLAYVMSDINQILELLEILQTPKNEKRLP